MNKKIRTKKRKGEEEKRQRQTIYGTTFMNIFEGRDSKTYPDKNNTRNEKEKRKQEHKLKTTTNHWVAGVGV